MWERIKGPVWLIIISIAWVIIDLILENFFNMYLVYFGIPVLWVSPVLFVIGVIWLIVKLVKK